MEAFKREISFKLDLTDDNHICVTNIMKDRFHDVLLEVFVDCETLVIKDIRVNFYRSPAKDCKKVQNRLNDLIGFTIAKGLSKKLYEVLGGVQGCTNLRNLLLGSLPLTLNFKAAEGGLTDEEILENIHKDLVGTCIGYAEPI